ncbi:MAG: pyruvate ferredoxin oxidoreductase [Deltaproteobacteria bacterium]|nr:pyruvate ferredoxin oxidoreductase [Deltaproteobacteria bacterium]MBW2121649.1 pyruvate ferredoxin oxidoreductase [Deltaproteobacteria bacterium]
MKKVITGNEAVAYGVALSRVQMIAAYPITPQTTIVEELSQMCADGRLKARFIKVESEHSAMASVLASCTAGARSFTATSSHGLALMHEMLHWAAGARLPVVMVNVNRAMGPPWNIWNDQTDSLSQRDTGWIQLYCENNQEVVDTIPQAYRIAETVRLPVMVVLDAFVLSHTAEATEIPEAERIDEFLPPFHGRFTLTGRQHQSFNPIATPDYYMEFRHKMQEAMDQAKEVVRDADERYERLVGRGYGMIEKYNWDGADTVLVTSGAVTGTSRFVTDELCREGPPVGLLKMKMFRPFPVEQIREVLGGVPKVAVLDRGLSFGHSGFFAGEIRSALCREKERPEIFGFVTGLGGRDVTPGMIREMIRYTREKDRPEGDIIWVGLKR